MQGESQDRKSRKGTAAAAEIQGGSDTGRERKSAPVLVPIFTEALHKAAQPELNGSTAGKTNGRQEKVVTAYESDFLDDVVAYWEDEVSDSESKAGEPPEVPADGATQHPANEGSDRFSRISAFLTKKIPDAEKSHIKFTDAADDITEVEGQLPADMDDIEVAELVEPAAQLAESDAEEATDEVPVELVEGKSASTAPVAEPFFDIPENVPHIEHEDTEEAPQRLFQRKQRTGRAGPLFVLFNIAAWSSLVLFFVFLALVLLYSRYALKRLFREQPSSRIVELTVQPGDSYNKIVERLRGEELIGSYLGIDDKYLMRYLAHANENSKQIQYGAYRLKANMSLSEIYEQLIKGSADYKITIPEGKTSREIAETVKSLYPQFNEDRFLELVKDQEFIRALGMDVPSLEGYLYPNTYRYGPGMKEEELIRLMVKQFRDKVEPRLQGVTKQDELSFHEHVIIASLIEREARIDKDRPLIASVIFNRLAKKMPLQVDASVNFALNEWSRPLTHEDLKVDSPYNTYKIQGLPPGPICNPRLSSITATFETPKTDFLFYVHSGRGSHLFAKSFDEHKENIKQVRKGAVGDKAASQSLTESPEVIANAEETPAA